MNIVIITPQFPYPLTSGGAQAQFNMIDELRIRHHITLIHPQRESTTSRDIALLKEKWPEVDMHIYPYWKQILFPSFFLSKLVRWFNIHFRASSRQFQVERILKPYGIPANIHFFQFVNHIIKEKQADVVQIEFYPLLFLVNHLKTDAKKVFIHHELRFVRNARLLSSYQLSDVEADLSQKIKQQEIEDLNQYDTVITLTDIDKETLRREGVSSSIAVSPAAVNSPFKTYAGWQQRIVFLGGYGHSPNVEGLQWFFESVLPTINWSEYPEVEFHIVGKGWNSSVIPQMPKNLRVVFRGFVENIEDAIAGSIMIIPILSGSGMRMKILEAASLGVPFLTTTVGVEGLVFRHNDSCLIEDSPEGWKSALLRLMDDEQLRIHLTTNASVLYQNKYSVTALAKIRESLITQS